MASMFLIVGGDSEIGAATHLALKRSGVAVLTTTRRLDQVRPERPLLDLAGPLDAWEPPPETRSVCICAAVARLAACAADPAGSARINVVQTLALIERLTARGIHVLFLSTNQVFDGCTPNLAADAPYSPVSEYGRQKAFVETVLRAQMAHGALIAILRLAKVVSVHMPLFAGWIRDLSMGKMIRAFHDMTLAPTPTDLVCMAIVALLQDQASGIFQLTGPRDVTYAEAARYIASNIGAEAALVREASALEAGLPVGATPSHTTLDSSALHQRYGISPPDVWEVLERNVGAAKRKLQSQCEM